MIFSFQHKMATAAMVNLLEALAVDNGWAALIVLLLGDPHLLEGGEGSKDGSSDPDGVFPLWGSDDLDLDGGWSKSSDFLCIRSASTGVQWWSPPDMTVLA
eukprot:TRINITY_DN23_c0_g1_i8.p2 TRINITY_DN23_c0_g1~~TRINITY_DN23_c0_g1_i8.p2  ORF type:complete len:101 (-),score=12.43 TRINITY_DN23_c0_g1_i8:68-370(-)